MMSLIKSCIFTIFVVSSLAEDVIPGGFQSAEISDVEPLVSKVKSDIQTLMEIETSCSLTVTSAYRQVVHGTNYQVDVSACSKTAKFSFFVALPTEDPEQTPQNLRLISLETDDSALAGGWSDVSSDDMSTIASDLLTLDAQIRRMLYMANTGAFAPTSAQQQVVAGMNYRVVLHVDPIMSGLLLHGAPMETDPFDATIQYWKQLNGDISALTLVSASKTVLNCYYLEDLQNAVDAVDAQIREMLSSRYKVDKDATLTVFEGTYNVETKYNDVVLQVGEDQMEVSLKFQLEDYKIVEGTLSLESGDVLNVQSGGDDDGKTKVNGGLIGGIVGGMVLLACVALLAVVLVKRSQKKGKEVGLMGEHDAYHQVQQDSAV